MIATIVYVKVRNDRIDDFRKACEINHLNSIREEGNLRFDILQRRDDPSQFVLYEAYDSENHAALHKETAHYKSWKETVEEMMVVPRRGISYSILNID